MVSFPKQIRPDANPKFSLQFDQVAINIYCSYLDGLKTRKRAVPPFETTTAVL
jgi:hypothetical protein